MKTINILRVMAHDAISHMHLVWFPGLLNKALSKPVSNITLSDLCFVRHKDIKLIQPSSKKSCTKISGEPDPVHLYSVCTNHKVQ